MADVVQALEGSLLGMELKPCRWPNIWVIEFCPGWYRIQE